MLQLPKKLSIRELLPDRLLMQKLLSVTAAAPKTLVGRTVYFSRTAKKILIIIFLLMVNIRGFGIKCYIFL